MDSVSAKITVAAPPEQVFGILMDLSARPAFTDHFMDEFRVERIPPDGVGAGARFQTGPRRNRIWMETVIADADSPRRIGERGHGGRIDRIPIFTSWELTPVEGPRTEVTVAFRTDPESRADRMKELGSRAWYRRRWGRALERLRDVVESSAPLERIQIAGGDRLPIT
jgi:uncharacterized protein YndB with AHSA1/START domain